MQLSAAERKAYFEVKASLSSDLDQFQKQQLEFRKLRLHLTQSVDLSRRPAIENDSVANIHASLVQTLQHLYKHTRPTAEQQTQTILTTWYSLKNKPATTSLDKWVSLWRKTFADAQRYNIPITTGANPHIQFLDAVEQYNQM